METDPTRMCELLVGWPEVNVLGIDDEMSAPLRVHIETRVERSGCSTCGSFAQSKGRDIVALVDLPAFDRPTRLLWQKRRWRCVDRDCPVG